jgi:putative transposase
MPRPHRNLPVGHVFHVVNRGNDRRSLFFDQVDYQGFMDLLLEAGRRFHVLVIAYCLMPNHWHLIMTPQEAGAVSAHLHWLTTTHSVQYRRRLESVGNGHVYQARFSAFPIQTNRHYFNGVKYVEANALRKRLVRRAEEWMWSSAYERVHGCKLVQPGPVELPANWLDFVNMKQSRHVTDEIRVCARAQRPYGDEKWAAATAAELGIESRMHPRGRPKGR